MGRGLQFAGLGAVVIVIVGLVWVFMGTGTPEVTAKLQPGHPVKWNEEDVKNWIRRTVRYPEYADAFLANSVDGPTLFYMKESHLEFLGVENPVHRVKFLAHLDVLRDECLCTPANKIDYWEYMRRNQFRVLVLMVLFFYAPRIGSLYLILVEAAVFTEALSYFGDAETSAFYYAAVSIMLLVPHVGLVLFTLVVIFPTNFILAIGFVITCFSNGYKDFMIVKEMLPAMMV